jgi:hypothetical protein
MKRLLLVLAFCSSLAAVLAQTPTLPLLISYHGRVADSTGTLIGNLAPTNREVHFKIYNHKSDSAAANRLYTEKQTVTIANGEFSVLIGNGTVPAVTGQANLVASLEAAFNPASGSGVIDRYLGISVADANGVMGAEIAPRQQIVTTAFALRAKVAEGLIGSITGSQIADSSITASKFATAANAFGYALLPDGLRVNIALNVNHPGQSSATSTIQAHPNHGTIFDLLDSTSVSKFSVSKFGDTGVARHLTVGGNLSVAGTFTGNIDGSSITSGTIPAARIAGGGTLADNSVTTTKIADGNVTSAKLASNLTFGGYPQFPTGARVDAGLNVNHPGTGGIASTMKAGGSDTKVLQLQSSSGSAVWDVSSAGAMGVAGRATLYSGLTVDAGTTVINGGATVSGGATISGGATVNNGLTVNSALTANGGGTLTGSFAGYPAFSAGLRANVGLNVNHPGTAGITSTMKGGTDDTQILEIRKADDTLLFRFGPTGVPYNVAGGNWFSYSDFRLKRNIQPLGGALEKLLRLRSVTFEFKDARRYGAGVRTGFIAQEVEEVFPDWVVTESDGIKALGAKGFESLTVQALRELRAEKDAQLQQRDATIAALEKNVAAMKTEATETKAQLAALQQAVAALSARASN